MSTFYEELKTLREQQGIDLAEIHNRTKIALSFLKALEAGQFDVLPLPYIRLFLKAYVKEIGGNPEKVITNLEQYLDKKNGKTPEPKPKTDLLDSEPEPSKTITPSTPTNTRANLIKGSVLLLIFIFSIIIIRKITLDPTEQLGGRTNTLGHDITTQDQLLENYTSLSTQTQVLNIEPPFSIKITCKQPIGFQVRQDTLALESIRLITGDQKTFSFDKQLDLLLNHFQGVYIYLNGENLNFIESHPYPVALSVTVNPQQLTIRQYTPIL